MTGADPIHDPVRTRAEAELYDTRYDAFRSLPRRRALVLATLVSFAGPIWLLATESSGLVLLIVSLGLAYFLSGLLRRVVRAMADLPSDYIDERIERVQQLAHKRAYHLFSGLTILGLLLVVLAVLLRDEVPLAVTGGQAMAAAFTAILLAPALPSMILAWTEPEI